MYLVTSWSTWARKINTKWVIRWYAECIRIWVASGLTRITDLSMVLPVVTGMLKHRPQGKALTANGQGEAVTLEDVQSKEKFTTDMHTPDKHFRYDYHIDGQIIIHEWDDKHLVTCEWIWCALTRSTDFNKVSFFKSVTSRNELNEETLTKYRTNKIKSCQIQDVNADRVLDVDKYISHEWFMKQLRNTCCNCGCRFEFAIKNGNLTSNMTAHRARHRERRLDAHSVSGPAAVTLSSERAPEPDTESAGARRRERRESGGARRSLKQKLHKKSPLSPPCSNKCRLRYSSTL